jgi:hypothetical protein
MLIIIVTSNWGQTYKLFFITPRKKSIFLDSTVECELRVYGQEMGEFERITRIYFVRN